MNILGYLVTLANIQVNFYLMIRNVLFTVRQKFICTICTSV